MPCFVSTRTFFNLPCLVLMLVVTLVTVSVNFPGSQA